MVAKASREESDGSNGVELIKDEPFENELGKGIFTHKIIHLESKLPEWTRRLIPESALQVEEKSWNAYPYSKTVYKVPLFGDRCKIVVESKHKEDAGETYNVFNLNKEILKLRTVDYIDIAHDALENKHYSAAEDPTLFTSTKTQRGPLKYGWKYNTKPVVCAYKLVTVEFNYPGLRKRGEKLIHDVIRSVYLRTHRQAFCWIDEWIDLTDEELRIFEKEMMQQALRNQKRRNGSTGSKVKEIEAEEENDTNAKKPTVSGGNNNNRTPSRSIVDESEKKPKSIGSGLKNLRSHFMRPKL
jgi:hypothetical protein